MPRVSRVRVSRQIVDRSLAQRDDAGSCFEVMKTVCKPGANAQAVWYRSSMIWVLNQFAQEQLAPWVKDGGISDAVFRTMATIPMEWVGHTEREGLPFDVEGFFRQLREGGVQNG